jgi:hypothetical protein
MKFKKKASPEPTRRTRALRDQTKAPQAYSYHAVRSQSPGNTGRIQGQPDNGSSRPNTKAFLAQKFGVIILVIVVIVCGITVLGLSTNPRVVILSSSAQQQTFSQPSYVYQRAAAKLFSASLLDQNKITVDTNLISQTLTKQFPELDAVSITIPLLSHRPIVYIEPSRPAVELNVSNGSFVLNDQGRALELVAEGTPLSLPNVIDDSGLQVHLGQQALTTDDITFIQTVNYELRTKGYVISSFSLPAGSSELDAHVTGKPYFVKFNLENNDPQQQAGTYLAAISQLTSQGKQPTSYVDVRVDGRAYYK